MCSNWHHDIRTRPTQSVSAAGAQDHHPLAMLRTANQATGDVCVWARACAPHLNVARAGEPLLFPRRQLVRDAHLEAAHGVVRVGGLEQDAEPQRVGEEGGEVEDKLGRGGRERGQRRFQQCVFPRRRGRALRRALRLLLRGEPAIAEERRHLQGDGRERVVQGTPVPTAPPRLSRRRRCVDVCGDARQHAALPTQPARVTAVKRAPAASSAGHSREHR